MLEMAGDVRIFHCILIVSGVFFQQMSCARAQDFGDLSIFGALGGLMGEMGVADKCEFECSNGIVPRRNPKHTPTSNGCGSYGLQLATEDLPGMTKCCDSHDICYDTCGTERKQCDKDFKKCLKKMCKDLKQKSGYSRKQMDGCKSTADLMYSGTTALGCNAFIESQQNACSCGSGRGRKKRDKDEF